MGRVPMPEAWHSFPTRAGVGKYRSRDSGHEPAILSADLTRREMVCFSSGSRVSNIGGGESCCVPLFCFVNVRRNIDDDDDDDDEEANAALRMFNKHPAAGFHDVRSGLGVLHDC